MYLFLYILQWHLVCWKPLTNPKDIAISLLRIRFKKMAKTTTPRGVRGICFRGGKVIFPDCFLGVKCFLPVQISHFGRPKTNFSGFEKWKAKRKKKWSSHPSFFRFSFFFLHFPFFLASLFPVSQQKFPSEKCQGALWPPGCDATAPTTR